MAALCASDEYILLTNGKTASLIHFSCPDEAQVLHLPVLPNGAKNKQPTKKKQKEVIKQQERQHDSDAEERLKENVSDQGDEKDSQDKAGMDNQILALAVSPDGQLIALCDDRKFLHVYNIEHGRCSLHFSRGTVHRCTSVTFTTNSQHVIVADKSGDAYDFDVRESNRSCASSDTSEEPAENDVATLPRGEDEDNSGGGSLLLGHHSMLLDLLVVDDGKLIVTCDRDEKIRISHYPDGYNIHAFCLGHLQFVVSLAYDKTRKVLISGSGDATVRLWTLNGQELHRRNVLPDIPAGCGKEQAETEVIKDVPQPIYANNNRQTSQTAIQQICFSPECQILFVSIYKSPHILVYKLADSETGDSLALQLISVLDNKENVASMAVTNCVLWVLRQGVLKLNVSAHRVQRDADIVKLVQVSEDTSTESMVLRTISQQTELLEVPPSSLDLVPSLWKSRLQEEFKVLHIQKRQQGKVGNDRRRKKQKR